MPFEPLCFVHAGSAMLDCQPAGLDGLTDELAETVEDATLTAFEHVVTAAVERKADFLLLTGDTFNEPDKSLRARVRLREGFQRLAEHGIRVFAMSGRTDPPEAWREIANLPDNVTTFLDRSEDPVAVLRDGRVIASVEHTSDPAAATASSQSPDAEAGSNGRRSPFRVGVHYADRNWPWAERLAEEPGDADQKPDLPDTTCPSSPFDYLAVGGLDRRGTLRTPGGIVHSPGPLHGLDPRSAGPQGGTLVEVEIGGAVRCEFLPAAPVTWQNLDLHLGGACGPEELRGKMRDLLAQEEFTPVERLRVVNWTVFASGSLHEELCEASRQQELIRSLPDSGGAGGRARVVHRLRVFPDRRHVEQAADKSRLAAEFFGQLEQAGPLAPEMLAEVPVPDGKTEAAKTLRTLIAEADRQSIVGRARRLGAAHFRPKTESGTE